MAANRDKLFRSAGQAIDADVSINIEYNPDPEKLYQKFKDGRNLTNAEIGVLIRNGQLEIADLEELKDHKGGFPGVFPLTK